MSSSQTTLLSHNHIHRHAESTGSTHSTQLPSCNCDLSGTVVKWCPMRVLLALLHYQSLGNDKTIYRSYLSTYSVVAFVHLWNRQPWLEPDWQAGWSVDASACRLYDVHWKWNAMDLVHWVAYGKLLPIKRSRPWPFQTSRMVSENEHLVVAYKCTVHFFVSDLRHFMLIIPVDKNITFCRHFPF